jgi:hypothetical protein
MKHPMAKTTKAPAMLDNDKRISGAFWLLVLPKA